MSTLWIIVAVAVILAVFAYKLLVKPLLKIIAIAALALIVWLLLTNSL